MIIFGFGLAVTSGALAALHTWLPDPGRPIELLVLVVANALATILRFVAYRSWIFHNNHSRTEPARQKSLA